MPGPITKERLVPLSTRNSTPILREYKYGYNYGPMKGKVVGPYYYNLSFSTQHARYYWDDSVAPVDCGITSPWGMLGFSNEGRARFAQNRAYARLLDRAFGDRSALGAALAEWRQTLGLIESTALEARRNWLAFRRGRWAEMISTRINPGTRNQAHHLATSASDAWLTWWFGIAPILGDIANSCQVLSRPLPSGVPVHGSDKVRVDEVTGPHSRRKGTYFVKTGCRVRLSNPNLFLANQLGLINPVSVAWEITPFSFLADWCFDVSSFLNSFSDFVGVEVTMPYTSHLIKGEYSRFNAPGTYGTNSAKQVEFIRDNKLIRPRPNTEVRANLGSSLTRAASAVALIIQRTR